MHEFPLQLIKRRKYLKTIYQGNTYSSYIMHSQKLYSIHSTNSSVTWTLAQMLDSFR